jgi:5-methyltetrahydropteroyltriglutamate--homocysteine methyltransferase
VTPCRAPRRIQTTVVGSYPVPEWLSALPSEQAVIDATRVVLHTQEQAGIDVVCDGELSRFDVNHPETNGMIEYFVRPMAGIRTKLTFDELVEYRAAMSSMRFRTQPPGLVEGPVSSGTLDLPQAYQRARALTKKPFKFTVTGPHMLAKTLLDKHYKSLPDLTFAIADALAAQVKYIDADVVQIDEANLPGSPDEWQWAAEAMNRVLKAVKTKPAVHLCFGNYGGQSIQKGTWNQLMKYLNALHADHIVMENAHRPAEELAAFRELKPEIGFGLGVVDIKSTVIESADSIARQIERAETMIGAGRIKLHPSGLRLLDAQALDRRRQDPRAGGRPRPLRRPEEYESRLEAAHDFAKPRHRRGIADHRQRHREMPAIPDETILVRDTPGIDEAEAARIGRHAITLAEHRYDAFGLHRRKPRRIEQAKSLLDTLAIPAMLFRIQINAKQRCHIAVKGRIRHAAGMRNQKEPFGTQPLVLRADFFGGILRDQRAQARAAERQRRIEIFARPVCKDRPFLCGSGESIKQTAGNSGHDRLTAEVSFRAASAVPWCNRTNDTKAFGAQRARFVDQAAPVIEFDADTMTENDRRRVFHAARFQHTRIDHIAEQGRRAPKRSQ